MTKTIWYIHGAYSTSRAFNWLKTQLPPHEAVDIDYSSYMAVPKIIDQLVEQAESETEFDIIGHSLGGVLAVALSQRCPKVKKVVTLSAPFGGSRVATFMQFLVPGSLLDDIQPFSPILSEVRLRGVACPVLSFVTSGGPSPLIFERNDGVVTVRSQKCLDGAQYVEVDLNHFEVLLEPATAVAIGDFLK